MTGEDNKANVKALRRGHDLLVGKVAEAQYDSQEIFPKMDKFEKSIDDFLRSDADDDVINRSTRSDIRQVTPLCPTKSLLFVAPLFDPRDKKDLPRSDQFFHSNKSSLHPKWSRIQTLRSQGPFCLLILLFHKSS
jgi:hypothetical protein